MATASHGPTGGRGHRRRPRALQVNRNFFWMFKSLLGLSTKGTLKTLTLVTSVASVVSLLLVMVAALVA